MNLHSCLVAILVFVGLGEKAVYAESTDAKERTAKKACFAGDYAKGVSILAELFVDTGDPAFVFNQGRCFEQNRRYEDAIGRFEEYLRVAKNATKKEKAEAQKHMLACQASLTKAAGAKGPTTQPAVAGDATTPVAVRGASKEVRERAAKRACLVGETADGVAILTDLYLDLNDTNYIFNQGRCFEQNRRYEDAVGRFREYLVKAKGLTPDAKADTEKHIADCLSYLGNSNNAEVAKAQQTESQQPPPQPRAREENQVELSRSPEMPPDQPGKTLRTLGWVGVGAGAAGLITGLVLNLKTNSLKTDLENDYDPAVASSRRSYKTAALVAYGAGGACLVAGLVLDYWGRRQARSSAVVLMPIVGPDTASAVLTGAF